MSEHTEIKKQMIVDSERKSLPPALSLFSLEGKTAIVTGASSGLGREIAIGFAMAGANVMLVARREEKLKELAEELKDFPVAWFSADVSETEDVKAMVEETVRAFGRIDVLVNDAGTSHRGAIADYPDELYDTIIKANMRSCWLCQKYVGVQMIKQGEGGSIINIGSGAGHDGKKESVHYCASKGGMLMLSRGAAIEWAEEGIRVNIVMPGQFKTPLLHKCISIDPDYVEKVLPRIPIHRFGEPQEIVGICIYLASDASSFMTGGVIYLDGGGNAQ